MGIPNTIITWNWYRAKQYRCEISLIKSYIYKNYWSFFSECQGYICQWWQFFHVLNDEATVHNNPSYSASFRAMRHYYAAWRLFGDQVLNTSPTECLPVVSLTYVSPEKENERKIWILRDIWNISPEIAQTARTDCILRATITR